MHLFYEPNIKKNFCLSKEESKHCTNVLRHKKGDTIHISDGNGTLYTAEIIEPKKICKVIILKEKYFHKKNHLHIAIAPTKNISRIEWFLEKSIEIGIEKITPLFCEKSERKNLNYNRLNKIIISASKQSLKMHIPKINTLTSFRDFLDKNKNSNKYIAHCNKEFKSTPFIKEKFKESSCILLIGPEGDFSRNEIKRALENGVKSVNLGNNRLRTETAGIYGAIAFSMLNT